MRVTIGTRAWYLVEPMLKLYHRTTAAAAEAILSGGFKDREKHYDMYDETGRPVMLRGVWLSEAPLHEGEGAFGDTLLQVVFPVAEDAIGEYEILEDEKPYREWCIPAAFVNERATVEIVAEDDEL